MEGASVCENHNTSDEENSHRGRIVYKTISGGLIASLAKSVLQHGIFWIVVYTIGFYNFSWKVKYQYTLRNLYIYIGNLISSKLI